MSRVPLLCLASSLALITPPPALHPARAQEPRGSQPSASTADFDPSFSLELASLRENLDPRLVYLLQQRSLLGTGLPGDLLPSGQKVSVDSLLRAARAWRSQGRAQLASSLELLSLPYVWGSIRFVTPPSPATREGLSALGVQFSAYLPRSSTHTVLPARIPWRVLPALSRHPQVLSVAPAWRLVHGRPLAHSRPQIETDQAWTVAAPGGSQVSGKGVLVADFDTGVNIYHPALFHADGPSYPFVDADKSGQLSKGDWVDIDGDGKQGKDETLAYLELGGTSQYGNISSSYDLTFDWLYQDENRNGKRDQGSEAGYGEASPAFGERIFRPEDRDSNGKLNTGDTLRQLGSSKFRAIRDRDGTVHQRGINLLTTEGDYYSHGSQVSGILAGGWLQGFTMSGVAPEAELLEANNDYTYDAPFLVPIEENLAWAATYDPDIFLIEDGEWIWQYLDGSSNVETMLDTFAAEGIIQIMPAGNLSDGHMHTMLDSSEPAVLEAFGNAADYWLSLLWREDEKPRVNLKVPTGQQTILEGDATMLQVGGFLVYSYHSVSSRGTHRLDVSIRSASGSTVSGDFTFSLETEKSYPYHGYFVDSASVWSSMSSWAQEDPAYTLTWPSTADSAIRISAYDPSNGKINTYSGWGPRIDEEVSLDLAAPGSTVYSTSSSSLSYTPFGGTSSAGPHAAGAAALLRQLRPDLSNEDCRVALREGALEPSTTEGEHRWGAGKLRIYQAMETLETLEPFSPTPEPEPTPSPTPDPSDPTTGPSPTPQATPQETPSPTPAHSTVSPTVGPETETPTAAPEPEGSCQCDAAKAGRSGRAQGLGLGAGWVLTLGLAGLIRRKRG